MADYPNADVAADHRLKCLHGDRCNQPRQYHSWVTVIQRFGSMRLSSVRRIGRDIEPVAYECAPCCALRLQPSVRKRRREGDDGTYRQHDQAIPDGNDTLHPNSQYDVKSLTMQHKGTSAQN